MTVPQLRFGAGDGAKVDLERLYESRLLIQGVSGSGKSTLIRALLEQTYGTLPHLVVDFDGDFVTLREKYDYVLVGPGGDVSIATKTAKITIRRLAELGVSAIFDISDMKFPDRREWVRLACEELVHLPRALWTQRLFVLDEAHIFAPERGSGESVATNAVIDVITLGRKRGIVSVCATQRLSKFHKDAAAELNNKLIGFTDDVDIQRAGDQLGMTKEQRAGLKLLETHTFYGYGPAISRSPVLVRTAMPQTKPPPRGKDRPAAPPARDKVKRILAQLVDLPKEAAEEAKSIEDFRKRNAELERRIRQAEKGQATKTVEKPVRDEAAIGRAVGAAVSAERRNARRVLVNVQRGVTQVFQNLERFTGALKPVISSLDKLIEQQDVTSAKRGALVARTDRPLNPPSPVVSQSIARSSTAPAGMHVGASRERPASSTNLGKGERAVLIAVAQYPDGAARDQLTVLTGYKRSSRDTYLQRLSSAGYVEIAGGGLILATDDGIAALGSDYEPLPQGEELQDYWRSRLPEGERRVFEVLVAAYPEAIAREQIDEVTGYKRSSRDTYLQRLSSRRLVENFGRGEVRASKDLF